jgi:hypothetical protein
MANFLREVEQALTAGVINGELIVVGTDGRDLLQIDRAGGELVVWANGKRLGRFDLSVTGIVVDGRGDDDLILISQQIDTDAEIYGGAGTTSFWAAAATTASMARTATTCSLAATATIISTAVPAMTSLRRLRRRRVARRSGRRLALRRLRPGRPRRRPWPQPLVCVTDSR